MHNVNSQRKIDIQPVGLLAFPQNLFAYITNFTQTHAIRQVSKVFDKSALFMQNKPNFKTEQMSISHYEQKDYENEQ